MNNLPMLFAVLIACVLGLVLVRRMLGARLKPVRTRSRLTFEERSAASLASDSRFRLERLHRTPLTGSDDPRNF